MKRFILASLCLVTSTAFAGEKRHQEIEIGEDAKLSLKYEFTQGSGDAVYPPPLFDEYKETFLEFEISDLEDEIKALRADVIVTSFYTGPTYVGEAEFSTKSVDLNCKHQGQKAVCSGFLGTLYSGSYYAHGGDYRHSNVRISIRSRFGFFYSGTPFGN